ncbi:MAG: FAD-dependent oxidoreductase [Gammaproteobacteria bacterium]|nr:FAD-dependent oxidoreductase [Gammaproteobacteria bacterium]
MAKKIVIVGGGFGGAFTAKYLRKYAARDTQIELINRDNYFVFQPLLPEVASGTINAPDAVTPLRQLLPDVRVRMATVTGIDIEAQRVHLLQGSFRTPHSMLYDHLVMAVGQKTNLRIAPGFNAHSIRMRSLADAHELRNKVIRRLEHADVTKDPVIKNRLLTFVVAGGGFSGVETIGEMVEMIHRTLRFYPNINEDEVKAILVQSGKRILPELPEKLGEYAACILRKRKVEVILQARVSEATANAVFLSDGRRIETCLLVTTVGNAPRKIAEDLGLELERGKIPVDRCMRVRGQDNIWSLGDSALIPMNDEGTEFAPPTAQFAVREAKSLAKNIAAILAGQAPTKFEFKPMGALASIGSYKGVAEIMGFSFSGLIAWMTWRFLYIGMLPGFSTRLRVALNWAFDYVLPRSIVQIANRDTPATITRYYKKGDVISSPGQHVDGFYAVLDGYLESRIPQGDGQDDFVRVLGPGDHWGERSASSTNLTHGTLTATEDASVLILGISDFRQLRAGLPPLDDYFKSISSKIYAPSLRDAGVGVDSDTDAGVS